MIRYGTEYGGYYLPEYIELNENSVVISAGVGEDISFDIELSNKYRCQIYCLDPLQRSKQYVELHNNGKLIFINKALSVKDTVLLHQPENKEYVSYTALDNGEQLETFKAVTIPDLIESFIIDEINLLKLDIEGCEYDVLNQMFECGIYPNYICVEWHNVPMKMPDCYECIKSAETYTYKLK